MSENIHLGLPALDAGTDWSQADLIVILLHGRGASAESMLGIAEALSSDGVRFIIPQAALNRWYPNTAFGPLEANEPDLSWALERVGSLVENAHNKGFDDRQIFLGGFSQGACLASEYTARNARRYGGVFVFSGALIGPPGMTRSYPGSFSDMPVFVGGSDVDPWVAHSLMRETAQVFQRMGAQVDFRTFPGMDHTVNAQEISIVRKMLESA